MKLFHIWIQIIVLMGVFKSLGTFNILCVKKRNQNIAEKHVICFHLQFEVLLSRYILYTVGCPVTPVFCGTGELSRARHIVSCTAYCRVGVLSSPCLVALAYCCILSRRWIVESVNSGVGVLLRERVVASALMCPWFSYILYYCILYLLPVFHYLL